MTVMMNKKMMIDRFTFLLSLLLSSNALFLEFHACMVVIVIA